MVKIFKWMSVILGFTIILSVAAVFLVPRLVDVQKYKPRMEQMVSHATGRPFLMGGDVELSLFPWVGISLSDLTLGNPEGFDKEKPFLTVGSFDVKVKLLPLLSRDIQVKEFVLDGPRVVLIKRTNGIGNWENMGSPPTHDGNAGKTKKPSSPETIAKQDSGIPTALPVNALAVERFAVINGVVEWHDRARQTSNVVSDIDLQLTDISLDAPVAVDFSARVDNEPVSLSGQVGPVGNPPGKGSLPLDVTVKLLEDITLAVKGTIVDVTAAPRFELALDLANFSPRSLVTRLGKSDLLPSSHGNSFNRFSVKADLSGDLSALSIVNGILVLDESTMAFSGGIKAFSKPDIRFDITIDELDLDQYLPPSKTATAPLVKESSDKESPGAASGSGEKLKTVGISPQRKMDYTPLRKLVLNGRAAVKNLKVKEMVLRNVEMGIDADKGIFNLDPFTMDLYGGQMASAAIVNVQKNTPKGSLKLKTDKVRVGPVIQALSRKDFLEGALNAHVNLTFTGDDPDVIKQNLNGKGTLVFTDGAIVGVDLAGMVRNVKANLGLGEKTATKPRTDFAELKAPFILTQGLFHTPGITMMSPLIRLLVLGRADLVQETLDLKVQPKFVATLKGQGDTKERSGLTVPVLVTGTFDKPEFRPDMEALVKTSIPQVKEIKKEVKSLIENKGDSKEQLKNIEDKAKDLLKNFSFGQ
ncbi:AsmA protein [Desulfocicer vacuolatum DSM 3385]|uniref:AsmA protein n=1 Tax=Desulfocicer vacuolatum DSM 3385 TaxID=1121400 RepID=A0A1W2CPZ5_9BACT|nr:AsmA family protein [Desulfocicer vacuolatum]SMC87325.1 AsmA protein [Desulfocicer vacuolatum DSM 3385]